MRFSKLYLLLIVAGISMLIQAPQALSAPPQPDEVAMRMAIGGWGDRAEVFLDKNNAHGGRFAVHLKWSDDPKTKNAFYHMGWPASVAGYDRVSFDILVLGRTNKGNCSVYLTEQDGDRWVVPTKIRSQKIGEWVHYEASVDQMRLWPLGDKHKSWESVVSFNLEPNGKNSSIELCVSNIVLRGKAGEKNLLDPRNLPRPYVVGSVTPAKRDELPAQGRAFVAFGMSYLTHEPCAHTLEELVKKTKHLGVSANGFAGYGRACELTKRAVAAGVPLMQEAAVGQSFAPEISLAGAWAVRWDGASNAITPGAFNAMHSVDLCNPAILDLNERRADAVLASGIHSLVLVDYVWPYWGGRWGYSKAAIDAYRKALLGKDGGLTVIENGKPKILSFWGYYEIYAGSPLDPKALGLNSWKEYTPTTEKAAWADKGPLRKNLHLFVILNHYEWLKFLDSFGKYVDSKGGNLWIIPNPEDLGNAADYVVAGRLAHVKGSFPEYFGNPMWTEALYRSGGYLARQYHQAGHCLGPQLEINAGGHGRPYYDPEVSYVVTYDLCASMNADVIKNDFLDEATFEQMTDPKTAQFDRYRDAMMKIRAFEQYLRDKPERPSSPLAVLTQRNVNRYRSSLFYSFDATRESWDGCLAQAFADETFLFDLMDPVPFAPLEKYNCLIWGAEEAPAAAFARVRDWLAAKPAKGQKRVLVCHSNQPTRRTEGLAFNPLNTPQDFIGDPNGGNVWELPRITRVQKKQVKLTTVAKPFDRAFLKGEMVLLPGGVYYAAKGGQALLGSADAPLVSRFQGPGDSVIYYLHYRAGNPDSLALDRRVVRCIAADLNVKPFYLSDSKTIVHTYKVDGGFVHVLWDRAALENWKFVYDANREQRLEYFDADVSMKVQVPVDHPGKYLVYDFVDNRRRVVEAKENMIALAKEGVICSLVYVLPDNEANRRRIQAMMSSDVHTLLTQGRAQ